MVRFVGFSVAAFVVYITCVGVCAVSMLATIKGSVANRLKNQVNWSNKRQKKLLKVCHDEDHCMMIYVADSKTCRIFYDFICAAI